MPLCYMPIIKVNKSIVSLLLTRLHLKFPKADIVVFKIVLSNFLNVDLFLCIDSLLRIK